MRRQSTSARRIANRAVNRPVQHSNVEPCSDVRLLERVAAGIRALGTGTVADLPTPGDQDLARAEFYRAVRRLRATDLDMAQDAR